MKKMMICLLVAAFAFMAADPASAWFWEKDKVKSPEVAATAEPEQKKGMWTRVRESFRGMKEDFKKSGKETKEGSKDVGRDLKASGKEIGRESKKVPGELKKSGKAIGQSFKQLGKDIKKGSKEALD